MPEPFADTHPSAYMQILFKHVDAHTNKHTHTNNDNNHTVFHTDAKIPHTSQHTDTRTHIGMHMHGLMLMHGCRSVPVC